MRIRNYFFAASAIVLAASCVKENTPESSEKNLVNYVPMEFSTAVETKTELTAEGKVNWLAGDQISIIDNSPAAETHNNQFTVVAGGSSSAIFTGTVPEDADEFYALYPYKSNASITDGSLSASLPANQNAKLGSFADDLAFMIAKADADNKLSFKNVCSHIKFTLAEGITNAKSITLMGNKAEILAGNFSVAWNNGDPAVTVEANRNAETYVTLRNEDGSVLAPGEYYFTVLPVTFAEGFTVIISKEDGSQIAKSTTQANDKVSTRNKVLVMKPLKASDYTSHLNYFVKYNDGFNLTFGGVTINNETHPDGILVSDNKSLSFNVAANPTGVYFIDSNCTKASINKTQAFESLVVIGADSSEKSPLKFTKVARLKDKGSLLLLANLDCDVNSNNGFVQHTEAPVTEFDNIVLSGCHVRNMTKNLFEFKLYDITKMNICLEDNDFAYGGDSIFLVNFGSMSSTVGNITFENNIYYSATGSQVSNCKLVGGDKTTVKKAVSVNGTFDKVIIPAAGLYRIASCEEVKFSSNFFVDCNDTNTGNLMSLRNAANIDKTAVAGEIVRNFLYTTVEGAQTNTGMSSKEYTGMSMGTTRFLTASPLSTSWNPAEGIFGPYESVQYLVDGTIEDYVPNNVGAKRPDMTGTADAASYRFPAVDLGTF